ncbi:MAG: hypothetical protein WBW03_14120, partial [Silvibacterium sp.]
QYPECGSDRSQGFLSLPSSARFHATDPTQTEAGRWRRVGSGSHGQATKDPDVDAVAEQRRNPDQ